ncbi:MAG: UDP-N-acetylmuramate dehydrogenase [Thiotrichales bacterium]
MLVDSHASLRAFNTLGVTAHARYRVLLQHPESLDTFRHDPRFDSLPRLILGGGSNVLLREDFAGVVLQAGWSGWRVVGETATHWLVEAGAGQSWHGLVRETIAHGYAGLENLSLIPGSVGAAPIQNIGAYGVELEERFAHLDAYDLTTGRTRRFDHGECAFGYRDSVFKRSEPDRWLITAVTLRLPKAPDWRTEYAGLCDALATLGPTPLSALRISDAVCALRRAKLPDPAVIGNAGSFFKNPWVSASRFLALKVETPELVGYPQPSGAYKLSAGWLIERCGWKGYRDGDAGVAAQHALVLVNHGTASGAELWGLAQRIIASVEARFGVRLEPEPRIIPPIPDDFPLSSTLRRNRAG